MRSLAVAALLCLPMVVAADDPLPCPIYTNPVPVLEAWTYFEHEAILVPYLNVGAGRLYLDYDVVALAAGYYHMESEGHPVAVRWRAGAAEHICGEVPSPLFWDDFELGLLNRWSATQGG
jgi:hypothetical protein